ncbi:LacI family DNA-binding transcriptional regulator [Selenomonas sp.]|uniref:LacI family DNA-binding transcriptional regulator n=1 Tax=Selenomonas sp. TaxID=2053611 RepID=UPI002A83B2E3|nr:LacI family DNA-binding transcriptional regulator [Selenomonas sp.]MDY4416136.1 LacI family DNA-binding transcriptional regulator [Selenomonas sp.]
MEQKRKATIVDVAKRAGVSVATVSRVVNANYPVKEETRKKVQEAIEALDYVPNVQARELNTQRSSTIGVVVPGLYNMFFAQVIDGIEDYVRQDDYSLLLNCAQNDPKQEMKCITALVARNVSGIIVISPNTAHIKESFYAQLVRRTPLVFINAYHYIPDVSYVGNDEALGTQEALHHLQGLGHERILFVRGEKSDSYQIKEDTFRVAMRGRGIDPDRYIINIGEGNSVETVDDTADRLMNVLPKTDATAVFCCNDLMGVGALNAANALGIRVPDDLSVMGFDNIALSRYVSPKLTTMDQNMFRLGSNAAQLLIERIETGQTKRVTLDNTLIARESTGMAPKKRD